MSNVSDAEKFFITSQIVSMFNAQYSRKLNPRDFSIKSITPHYNTTHGYEIWTTNGTNLRIRYYFNLTHAHFSNKFRLALAPERAVGALGDEVYIANGSVNEELRNSGAYSFNWIGGTNDVDGAIFFVQGNEPINFVEGGYIEFAES